MNDRTITVTLPREQAEYVVALFRAVLHSNHPLVQALAASALPGPEAFKGAFDACDRMESALLVRRSNRLQEAGC